MRRAGSRVRITAQLIDAEIYRHLWAERYDRELADIFAIQDEVTFRLGQSSIFPIKGIRMKRCAVKSSSLIISQRCSGRRPEAFSGREPINISRFGVMFFSDPVVAFTNIRRSLKPSGRLVFVCWRPLKQNPWIYPLKRRR